MRTSNNNEEKKETEKPRKKREPDETARLTRKASDAKRVTAVPSPASDLRLARVQQAFRRRGPRPGQNREGLSRRKGRPPVRCSRRIAGQTGQRVQSVADRTVESEGMNTERPEGVRRIPLTPQLRRAWTAWRIRYSPNEDRPGCEPRRSSANRNRLRAMINCATRTDKPRIRKNAREHEPDLCGLDDDGRPSPPALQNGKRRTGKH